MKRKNESSKNSASWIVGILLAIVLLAGGGYLVYRFWFKKSPEQIQQEQEKKDKLRQQIKLLKEKISYNKTVLENKKAGQEDKFDIFDETFEEINFSNLDQEVKELQEEKQRVLDEYDELNNEIQSWILEHNQKTESENNKNLVVWNKQKNGNWKILTERLDKDPTVKAKFNQFITTFYHKYKELKKDIPTHPAVNLRGFGHFYIDENVLFKKVTEMGRTVPLSKEGDVSKHDYETKWTIHNHPQQIDLNQLYLLNNGRNPGGRMDKFFCEEPKPGSRYLEISFDKLIQTIAHEIAHAFQTAKNVDEENLLVNKEGVLEFSKKLSDCWESGDGERDDDFILVNPDYPELVKEHKQFEEEIEQMIRKSPLFEKFKVWWEVGS